MPIEGGETSRGGGEQWRTAMGLLCDHMKTVYRGRRRRTGSRRTRWRRALGITGTHTSQPFVLYLLPSPDTSPSVCPAVDGRTCAAPRLRPFGRPPSPSPVLDCVRSARRLDSLRQSGRGIAGHRCILAGDALSVLLPGPGSRCEAGEGVERARQRRRGSRTRVRDEDEGVPLRFAADSMRMRPIDGHLGGTARLIHRAVPCWPTC